jgi:MSHA pilin protein MshC
MRIAQNESHSVMSTIKNSTGAAAAVLRLIHLYPLAVASQEINSAKLRVSKSREAIQQGFTLVELIVVIMVIGLISAVAIPRFLDRVTFDARGYYDQALTMVRYAQKLAIAQHRNVYVRLDGASIALCFDAACTSHVLPPANNNSGSTATLAVCGNSTVWMCEAVPSGVTYTPTNAGNARFFFSALGKPYNSADTVPISTFTQLTIAITGDSTTRNVVVEQETGYVH